jgi:hypothetical protein
MSNTNFDGIMAQYRLCSDLRIDPFSVVSGKLDDAESKLRVMIENAMKAPDGWKLVPVICTPGIEAVYSNDTGAYQTAQELHDAMLSAAPTYEVKK